MSPSELKVCYFHGLLFVLSNTYILYINIFLSKANPIETLAGDIIHVVDAENSIPFIF